MIWVSVTSLSPMIFLWFGTLLGVGCVAVSKWLKFSSALDFMSESFGEFTIDIVFEIGVALIGAGRIGSALFEYGGFSHRGFDIVTVVDTDPAKIGETWGGVEIRHADELATLIAKEKIDIKSKAEVFGDVRSAKLVIEEGVTFVGKTEVNPNKVTPSAAPKQAESPKAPEPAKLPGR